MRWWQKKSLIKVSCLGLLLGLLWGLSQPGRLESQPLPGGSAELGLSPVQVQALAEVEEHLGAELRRRRQEFLARRLEFRLALANPRVDPATIRTKAAALRQGWQNCQQLATDYYLAIRAILTPEQWQRWWQIESQRGNRGKWAP